MKPTQPSCFFLQTGFFFRWLENLKRKRKKKVTQTHIYDPSWNERGGTSCVLCCSVLGGFFLIILIRNKIKQEGINIFKTQQLALAALASLRRRWGWRGGGWHMSHMMLFLFSSLWLVLSCFPMSSISHTHTHTFDLGSETNTAKSSSG